MELVHRQAEATGVAADVVERDQAQVAVEGRVLDALRRHRRRCLLKARDELLRRAVEQLRPAGRRQRRGVGGLEVTVAHVGAVDRQPRERLLQPARVVDPRQPPQLARERRARPLELRFQRDLLK